jgi:hypothetical protein
MRMNAQLAQETDPEAIRRHVTHVIYNKLAFISALIWSVGTLILFTTFAANDPNPVPITGVVMTIPLLPAALVWALYRPLIHIQVARRLRSLPATRRA